MTRMVNSRRHSMIALVAPPYIAGRSGTFDDTLQVLQANKRMFLASAKGGGNHSKKLKGPDILALLPRACYFGDEAGGFKLIPSIDDIPFEMKLVD